MSTRIYKSKDSNVLTIGEIIADNAIANLPVLTAKRESWADPYFPNLKIRINTAYTI